MSGDSAEAPKPNHSTLIPLDSKEARAEAAAVLKAEASVFFKSKLDVYCIPIDK
jgi:hypothetical protein